MSGLAFDVHLRVPHAHFLHHCRLSPDFITFLCHLIAVADYQQISYNFGVVLSGAGFIAYKVYKELERIIAINKTGKSVDQVLDTAKTITTIRIKMPENGTFFTKTLF